MSTAQQDAVSLLTLAMHAEDDELDELIEEFAATGETDDLLRAVVQLCRSLCLVTSRMVHVVDDALTNEQAFDLSDDQLLPMAMEVVRRYANAAARGADVAGGA
jgi:hypothetical protein